MKKIILTLVCAVMMLGCTAFAECVQTADDEITVNFELGSEFAGAHITLDMFADGKSAEDLKTDDESEYMKYLVARIQDTVDSEGNFSCVIGIDNVSGKYVVYATVSGMEEYIIESVDFINIMDFNVAVGKINEQIDATPDYALITSIIDEYAGSFALTGKNYELFSGLDDSKFGKIFLELADNKKLDESDREGVLKIVNKAFFLQCLNEEKTENIFSDTALAGLEDGELKEWYDKPFVKEAFELDMTKRLSGKDFKDFEDYEDALIESFVLATVKNPSGYENIKDVVKEFDSEIGFSYSSDVKESVWTKLAGEDFDDIDEFLDEYKSLTEKSTSGSGSSGSSGSKNTSKTQTSVAVTETKEKPTMIDEAQIKEWFLDVPAEHWAYEPIKELYNAGIVNGKSETSFEPESFITREEFVKLISACIENAEAKNFDFSDVSEGAWYYQYIQKAYSAGVITGYSDEYFGIGECITRQDLATIAYRILKMKNPGMSVSYDDEFVDDEEISEYAKEAVYILKNRGIISGAPGNMFNPKENATRAQACKIICNLLAE